jgi:hypothetical protein
MDIVDVTDWAADEIRTVVVTHAVMDVDSAPTYEIKVRKVVPKEGDLLKEIWKDKAGNEVCYPIPPYAIADLRETVRMFKVWIEERRWLYQNVCDGQGPVSVQHLRHGMQTCGRSSCRQVRDRVWQNPLANIILS